MKCMASFGSAGLAAWSSFRLLRGGAPAIREHQVLAVRQLRARQLHVEGMVGVLSRPPKPMAPQASTAVTPLIATQVTENPVPLPLDYL